MGSIKSGGIGGILLGLVLLASPRVFTQTEPEAKPETKFEVQCPEEIHTQQKLKALVKGWNTHVEALNSRQIFTAAYLYEGHPKDGVQMTSVPVPQASLTGGQQKGEGGAGGLDMLYEVSEKTEVYFVCQYGNTLVRLFKKLPKGLKTCTVKFSETLGFVQKVVCD